MTTFSRREMFSGTAAMLGAACLAPGNTVLAEGGEYMFAHGLIYLNTGSLGPTPRSIYGDLTQPVFKLISVSTT